MQRPDTEAVQGMVRGDSGEYKQAVFIEAAQLLCHIHAVFTSHINIKEYKVKMFFSGIGKEIRAGSIVKDGSIKGKPDGLSGNPFL